MEKATLERSLMQIQTDGYADRDRRISETRMTASVLKRFSPFNFCLKLGCINWVQGEVVFKKINEPGRLGTTQRELVPTCLVKSVSHWNTLYTTKTSQTGQATSSLQRPLDPSTSGWLLHLFLYIPDGTSPSSCCTLEQTILRPVKQSSPALSTARTIGLMPFLGIRGMRKQLLVRLTK